MLSLHLLSEQGINQLIDLKYSRLNKAYKNTYAHIMSHL